MFVVTLPSYFHSHSHFQFSIFIVFSFLYLPPHRQTTKQQQNKTETEIGYYQVLNGTTLGPLLELISVASCILAS